jgi:hypothetical protein
MSLLWKIQLYVEEVGQFLFKKLSQTEAECNACHQKIKLSNRGTSNLKSHLAKHPVYLKKFDQLEKAEESKTEAMQQGLAKFVVHGKGIFGTCFGTRLVPPPPPSSILMRGEGGTKRVPMLWF